MALRKRPRTEDLLIGVFVLLALLYPFIITLLIQMERENATLGWRERLRVTALFVAGLEECTPERALQIAEFFERDTLRKIGGPDSLIKLCLRNKSLVGDRLSLKEKVMGAGDIYTLEVKVYTGSTALILRVSGEIRGGDFKITDLLVEAAGIEPASEDDGPIRGSTGLARVWFCPQVAHGQAPRGEHGSVVGGPSPCVGTALAGVSDAHRQATRQLTGGALPL